MKISSVVLLALLPAVDARNTGGNVVRRNAHATRRGARRTASTGGGGVHRNRRRRTLGGGGLMKMDYIMDFRGTMSPSTPVVPDPTSAPVSTPTPPPVLPTPSPVVPTASPVVAPTPPPVMPTTPPPVPTPPPTDSPTDAPTDSPVVAPTPPPIMPTTPPPAPTPPPTGAPTASPVVAPTPPPVLPTTPPPVPTPPPTDSPTGSPESSSTVGPTNAPTGAPVTACEVLDNDFFEIPDDEYLDIFFDGYGPGDVFTWSENALQVDQQPVGESHGRCIVLQDTSDFDNIYCTIEYDFGGGNSLIVQGVFFELVAVTGTGCYEGIKGFIDQIDDPSGDDRFGYQFIEETDNGGCSDADAAALLSSPWNHVASRTEVDWDSDGAMTLGDVWVFDLDEVTTPGGPGFLEGECMVLYDPATDAGDASNPFCVMTFYTANGDLLQMQGLLDNMIITSGLGCFFEATGIVSGAADGANFVYTLDTGSTGSNCATNLFDQAWTEEYGDAYVDYPFEEVATDDYYHDFFSPGDAYVFENKVFQIPSTGGTGILSGRCFVPPDANDTYCNIQFVIEGQGSIIVQGFFLNLVIVGGSGCFADLSGSARAEDTGLGFSYDFTIV